MDDDLRALDGDVDLLAFGEVAGHVLDPRLALGGVAGEHADLLVGVPEPQYDVALQSPVPPVTLGLAAAVSQHGSGGVWTAAFAMLPVDNAPQNRCECPVVIGMIVRLHC